MTDEPQNTPPPNPGQVPGGYQPPPGQYPPPGAYGAPGQYPPPGGYLPPGHQPVHMPPKHPQATLAMVLGIIGLTGIFCYVTALVGPFAWWLGAKSVKEIDADPMRHGGRGEAMAGKVMGIIGTVLLILGIIAIVGLIALALTVDDFWDDAYDDYSLFGAF